MASGGLVIRARTDEVMRLLITKLTLPVPPYIRQDAVVIHHSFQPLTQVSDEDGCNGTLKLLVHSVHGKECAIPAVTKVEFEFQKGEAVVIEQAPFVGSWPIRRHGTHPVSVKLHLHSEADEEVIDTTYVATVEEGGKVTAEGQTVKFQTQVVEWAIAEEQQQHQQEEAAEEASKEIVKKQRVA